MDLITDENIIKQFFQKENFDIITGFKAIPPADYHEVIIKLIELLFKNQNTVYKDSIMLDNSDVLPTFESVDKNGTCIVVFETEPITFLFDNRTMHKYEYVDLKTEGQVMLGQDKSMVYALKHVIKLEAPNPEN